MIYVWNCENWIPRHLVVADMMLNSCIEKKNTIFLRHNISFTIHCALLLFKSWFTSYCYASSKLKKNHNVYINVQILKIKLVQVYWLNLCQFIITRFMLLISGPVYWQQIHDDAYNYKKDLNTTHLNSIFNVENDFNPSQKSKFFAPTKWIFYYRDN